MGSVVFDRWGDPLGSAEKRLADFVEAEPDEGLFVVFHYSFPPPDDPDGDIVGIVTLGRKAMLTDGRLHFRAIDITGNLGDGIDAWRLAVSIVQDSFEHYRQSLGLAEQTTLGGLDPDYADSAE